MKGHKCYNKDLYKVRGNLREEIIVPGDLGQGFAGQLAFEMIAVEGAALIQMAAGQ